MLKKRYLLLALVFCLTALVPITANAEFTLEISESLKNGASAGTVGGGRWTETGWQSYGLYNPTSCFVLLPKQCPRAKQLVYSKQKQ